ncbi:MAG: hypothetical protein IPO22_01140 [Anaerolineales bacterium]|nr:hypothetical protein [Anaerolineales bacterium]
MRKIFSGIGLFLQTPPGIILTITVVWHGILLGLKIPFNYISSAVIFIIDFAAAYYLQDWLIYFFSQFVLPIQNPKDRDEIHARVRVFESGNRGPTLFVKNGRVIEHPGESEKRGAAGVIVLDTASALVLRTDTEITSTVGPGIKFTKPNEYIAGSVDLRTQWQSFGPQASDPPVLNSTNPKDLPPRFQQTAGQTRDGFYIYPNISIKFSIKRPKEPALSESGVTSRYGFDATSVRNAITREVVRLSSTDNNSGRMDWNKLPAHLVINLWREYIRKFKLEDLFTQGETNGLQTIQKMINTRVTQDHAVALDDTGVPTGEWLESMEYKQLESRGLEIMEVHIHNLHFDQPTEDKLVDQWSADWLNNAQKEKKFLEEKEALIETASREEASKIFAKITSEKFGGKVTMPQQNPFKTLQLLIQPLKEYFVKESNSNSDMETELKKLDDIWKWLLDNSSENPQGRNDL